MDPVARRYAQALTEEARSGSSLDAVDADVALIAETLDGSRDLRSALVSPIVATDRKAAVLASLFGDKVSDLTMRVLRLLLDKQRAEQIPAVLAAYAALRDERTGTVAARVKSAKPLSPDEADRLKAALEAQSGKTIRMHLEVDPSLVGGLVVRVGDVVYDQSVKHQLDTLRGQLMERAAVSLN